MIYFIIFLILFYKLLGIRYISKINYREKWNDCIPNQNKIRHVKALIIVDPTIRDYESGKMKIIKEATTMNNIFREQIGIEITYDFIPATLDVSKII